MLTNQLEWEKLYSTASSPHFRQSFAWNRHDSNTAIVITRDRFNNPVAGSIIIKRRSRLLNIFFFQVIRGPLFVDTHSLQRHLVELRSWLPAAAAYLTLSPYLFDNDQDSPEVLSIYQTEGYTKASPFDYDSYRSTLRIDLSQSLDEISRNYRSGFRRQLKKAEALNVNIRLGNSGSDLEQFIEGYKKAHSRTKLGVPTSSAIKRWRDLFQYAGSGVRLSFAELGERPVAAQIAVRNGDTMVYEWGYSDSDPALQNIPKSHLLHHATIKNSQELGLNWYDLGGYWKEQGKMNSINRFKLSISNSLFDLLPAYNFVNRPVVYQAMNCSRWLKQSIKKHIVDNSS